MTDQASDNSATTQTDTQTTQVDVKNDVQTTVVTDQQSTQTEQKSDWNDNWRDTIAKQYAGENQEIYDKEIKRLQRFQSPADVYKSARELEKKLSSGQMKQVLPDNATPEQLAEWRKENGIPEAIDKYDLTLDKGLIVGEADKPMVDQFLESMHGANANNKQVQAALNTYYKLQDQAIQQRHEKDVELADKCSEVLREEWGGEFKKNLVLRDNLLAESFPGDTGKQLLYARLPDGTPVGSHPELLRGLVKMAREINPTHTVVPGSGDQAMANLQNEMKSLENKMGTTAYTESDRARYVELTEAYQGLTRRS